MTINSGGDNFPFTDHERDGENSTDATLFRHYSPTQLRWLSPDPYNGSYHLSDPQSLNRYAYLTNRPMSATDPMGLDCTYGGSGTTLTVNCGGSGDGPLGGDFSGDGGIWDRILGRLSPADSQAAECLAVAITRCRSPTVGPQAM